MTGADLLRVYSALRALAGEQVDQHLDDVGLCDPPALEDYYSHNARQVMDGHHSALAAWLVATIGPDAQCDVAAFEQMAAFPGNGVVAARWVLSVPVKSSLIRRCPARPFVWPSGWERKGTSAYLRAAYEGLLTHLDREKSELETDSELTVSAIPWRLITLVEGLEPEVPERRGTTMPARLSRVVGRTRAMSRTTLEQGWVQSIDSMSVLCRRNALTHLYHEPNDGSRAWTFLSCQDAALSTDQLLDICAGMSLAVLDRVAQGLRDQNHHFLCSLASMCERDVQFA